MADVVLTRGSHRTPEDGLCLLELVAHEQGQRHTESPEGVSPLLIRIGQRLNDLLPDQPRQRLLPLRHGLPGTAGDGLDERRAYMAANWLARVWLPTWLDLVPEFHVHAARLRELDRVVDQVSAANARTVARRTRLDTAAAWDVAQTTAETTVHAAAETAVRAAAGTSVMGVSWDVDIPWLPAESAAWVSAEMTAIDAAARVSTAMRADAAKTALAPTVATLQSSAIELYADMIRGTWPEEPNVNRARCDDPDPMCLADPPYEHDARCACWPSGDPDDCDCRDAQGHAPRLARDEEDD